jgi:hypothetical protein
MRFDEWAASGQTLVLDPGDDLDRIPRSHRKVVTAAVRAAFTDPAGYLTQVANRCPFDRMARWLVRLAAEGRWTLCLHRGPPEAPGSVAAFDWRAEGFRGAVIGLPDGSSWPKYPPALCEYYGLVGPVHWTRLTQSGGLKGAEDHLRLDIYASFDNYKGDPIDPERTFVWGGSFCGDYLLYTDDGHAAYICLDDGYVHLLGTIPQAIDWVYGQLLADRWPDFDHGWRN